ncbi:MAG: DUF502 domain-containing protein [Deltaproteobacteria bacterium]|nr:DUF502 domain-containing protein [Deltaproteobacteria bacterium]
MKRLKKIIKGYFITGLLVILPLFVTVYILWIIVKAMDSIFKFVPAQYLPETYIHITIPGLGLLLMVAIILLVGLFTKNFIGTKLFGYWENIVERIPIARIIYIGVKQLLEALFYSNKESFKTAALVEYPRRGIYVIGFITGESKGEVQDKTDESMINVFIPTTPNPTSGFYVLVSKNDLIILDMSVEDAFKLIISGGIITPKSSKGMIEGQTKLGILD